MNPVKRILAALFAVAVMSVPVFAVRPYYSANSRGKHKLINEF